ncbi:MAG: hypothetical protein IJ239_00560, partial [Eubacterium sp.]|nr:hypothetical protein [Eubacterium sp.]
LLCEMFTSEWSHERMLWVESISMTAYEQKQSRAKAKGIASVWRRIQNYFRERKRGMEYGNW